MKKQVVFGVAAVVLCLSVILAAVFMKTAALPDSFDRLVGESGKTQFLDSSGEILNASYQSYWNVVESNKNPKDVLLKYSKQANEEIERKWKQYE